MDELIKVTESGGKKAVSAKELYLFLGYDKSQWSRWSTMNIVNNQFAFESIDWHRLDTMSNGNETKDYAITIDFAKRLSMMAKTEKGEQARRYFIECENIVKRQLTQSELILQSAQMLVEFERKQNVLETRIEAIENRPQINAPVEHFSIMGYCHNKGMQVSVSQAKDYSMKCKRLSNELGLVIGKVPDSRYGSVNTYASDVLQQIIG